MQLKIFLVENATWDVGACSDGIPTSTAYTCAHGTTWTGKIGLIATYEYLYAAENDGTCWSQLGGLDACAEKDWLNSTMTNDGRYNAWTLSPLSGTSGRTLLLSINGYVQDITVTRTRAASPVVCLKSTVIITGGNGGSGETNSYKLG